LLIAFKPKGFILAIGQRIVTFIDDQGITERDHTMDVCLQASLPSSEIERSFFMYFEQFKVDGLGCYSYIIGCPGAGTACVVDPERHINGYLAAARKNHVKITHVFDTHLHADHISGARDLAAATGARICIHPAVEADFDHQAVHENDCFTFGSARIEVLETPGHTPNSISLVVSDLTRSEEPMFICTGDLLFVGDIGRPDLAGEDLLEEQVKNLYHSLYEKLGRFQDHIEVYPAHGKGSLCGKGMSSKPMSTLGYERRWNPLLKGLTFDSFRKIMTGEFEIRPPGFMTIVDRNKSGPELIAKRPPLKELEFTVVEDLRKQPDTRIVDIRNAAEFGGAYIPGSINIGLVANSAMWLGMTLSADKQIVIVSDDYKSAQEAEKQFRRVGFDRFCGCLSNGIDSYVDAAFDLEHLPQLTVASFNEVLEKYSNHKVLDVRNHLEQKNEPFENAIHKPMQQFVAEGIDLPKNAHITVVCSSGYRSNIVGSILKAQGYGHVFCLMGGTNAWNKAHNQSE
jgi:hydroxyacylglutathione hydrolase